MNIQKNVDLVRQNIRTLVTDPEAINIVAATKYVGVEQITSLFEAGITIMGENRVDSLLEKKSRLKLPVEWHLIGTLQSRKVKEVINEISCLHSLDRLSLAKEIQKYRIKPLKCFVQVNVSGEETKHGLEVHEVVPFLNALREFPMIEVIGFMTMAPNTEDEEIIRQCFHRLKQLQIDISDKQGMNYCNLSMGMSNDYVIAIEEGATHIRLGSILFQD